MPIENNIMRNPCINCKDGYKDRNKCDCPHWDKRIEYLDNIQQGGVYLNSVGVKVPKEKMVDDLRLPAVGEVSKSQTVKVAKTRKSIEIQGVETQGVETQSLETQDFASLQKNKKTIISTDTEKKAENIMKNKLTNLNDHLFMQLERLTDEKLKGDQLAEEISRSKAVSQIAGQIIFGGKLALDAQIALRDGSIKTAPGLLEITNDK